MEFLRDVFTFKIIRQELVLRRAGVTGSLRQELLGPEYKKTRVAAVNNDEFLRLVLSRKPEQILRHLTYASDTHVAYDVYLDLGHEVNVKTQVGRIDYNPERDLLSSLEGMGYIYNPLEPKHEHGDRTWGNYMLNSEHA